MQQVQIRTYGPPRTVTNPRDHIVVKNETTNARRTTAETDTTAYANPSSFRFRKIQNKTKFEIPNQADANTATVSLANRGHCETELAYRVRE